MMDGMELEQLQQLLGPPPAEKKKLSTTAALILGFLSPSFGNAYSSQLNQREAERREEERRRKNILTQTVGNIFSERAKNRMQMEHEAQPFNLPAIREPGRPTTREDIGGILQGGMNPVRQKEGLSPLSLSEAIDLVPQQDGGFGMMEGKTLVPAMRGTRGTANYMAEIGKEMLREQTREKPLLSTPGGVLDTKTRMMVPGTEPQKPLSTDQLLAKRVQDGEMTLEEAMAAKNQGKQDPTQVIDLVIDGQNKKALLNKRTGEKDIIGDTVARGNNRAGFINESSLRNEFTKHPTVKDFREVTSKYANMEQAIQEAQSNPSSLVAVDQALITMFNKMLDPQSVVRESEYARTPEDIGFFNRIAGKIEKLRTGGAGLTDEERDALVRMARRFYEVSELRYQDTENFYGAIAEQNGVERARVIQPLKAVGESRMPSAAPSPSGQQPKVRKFDPATGKIEGAGGGGVRKFNPATGRIE